VKHAFIGFVVGILVVVVLFACAEAKAATPYPMTITTCKGYAVSKRGDGTIFVRCPGKPIDQWLFSIAAGCCPNPVLTKRTLSLTIDCR